MEIIRNLEDMPKIENPVITIGNFDGLHVGHKKIIGTLKDLAFSLSGKSILMTFDPHPLHVLKPKERLKLITPLPLKISLIEKEGVDYLLLLPFDETLRFFEAKDFIEMLVKKIGIKGIVIGADFRFGRERKGDIELLERYSKLYDFRVVVVQKVEIEGERVGSQKIRGFLLEGEIKKANLFLGRPYEIHGKVIHGKKRNIGFRTANISTDFDILLKEGVYITEFGLSGKIFPSVTNIGHNPTFAQSELSIETHILDFSEDIYGKDVKLFFLERIRDEIAFKSERELKEEIKKDLEITRSFFQRLKKP